VNSNRTDRSRIRPFDEHADEYDRWFEDNAHAYESELEAVGAVLPRYHRPLEIGVGSGRFAVPLGIPTGIEPSRAMADLARKRGVEVVGAIAEELPFADAAFDLALMVTVVCFLGEIGPAFSEAYRVLEPGGHLVVGFLDRDTGPGRAYQAGKEESTFFRRAGFRSSDEISIGLKTAGFIDLKSVQTLFGSPEGMREPSTVRPGRGSGLFVVIRGSKA
jgi:SAM-dependent methyltransferase